jgi:hypothetical protein
MVAQFEFDVSITVPHTGGSEARMRRERWLALLIIMAAAMLRLHFGGWHFGWLATGPITVR